MSLNYRPRPSASLNTSVEGLGTYKVRQYKDDGQDILFPGPVQELLDIMYH